MGQLQKALPPLLMALGIRAKFESVNHFSMSEIYHQIGKVLQAREEFDDALRALSKASEIQRKSSEKCHEGKFCEVCLELSETLLNLGRLHHGWGDFAESLTAYREVLAIFLRIFGKNHLQTARLHVIIANLELELGHVAQAMSNFEEAARIELEQGQTSLERTTVKVKNPLMRVTFSHHPCASSA
jgi:tetratricopeptide (TPR) repeat protein